MEPPNDTAQLHDIETREDILHLIRTFYQRIRTNALLGPIFNGTIQGDAAWEHHFQRLTDFWEGNLFGRTHYVGNPVQAHQEVDAAFGHAISSTHFTEWLRLWRNTVNELYAGQRAGFAMQRAEGIAFHLMRRIQEKREGKL